MTKEELIAKAKGLGLKWWVKLIIGIVIAIILWIAYKKISAYFAKIKAENTLSNSIATYTGADGIPVTVNYGSVAQQIHDAFYNYWGGLAEDEETAIISLNNVPKPLIPVLKTTYFNLYAKDLNGDFVKYLSASDYARVTNLLN